MSYVITELCMGEKAATCYAVCPVDAIHPGPDEKDFARADQLYINPAECIECGACEAHCPHGAIFEESEIPDELRAFVPINASYFQLCPPPTSPRGSSSRSRSSLSSANWSACS
jgi:NAD-dependent dihydropyrimidine dehydrogenase PreA subunit